MHLLQDIASYGPTLASLGVSSTLYQIWEHNRAKKHFSCSICLPPSIFKSDFLVRGLDRAILSHNITEGALGSLCHLGPESFLESSIPLLLRYTTWLLAVWRFWWVTCWLIAELAKVRRVLRAASVQRAKYKVQPARMGFQVLSQRQWWGSSYYTGENQIKMSGSSF